LANHVLASNSAYFVPSLAADFCGNRQGENLVFHRPEIYAACGRAVSIDLDDPNGCFLAQSRPQDHPFAGRCGAAKRRRI
jgi:hypothetical protein